MEKNTFAELPQLQLLKTLRDEVRLQIHLAGMDARDAWHQLEPEIERMLKEAETAGHELANDLFRRLQDVRQAIRRTIEPRLAPVRKRRKTSQRRQRLRQLSG